MELAGRDGRLACSLIWTGFKRRVLTNWSAYDAYRSAHMGPWLALFAMKNHDTI